MAIDPGSLLAGFAALGKTAADIAGASDATKRNALLIEFQQGHIQANLLIASEQATNATLRERNRELEQQVVKLKNWEAESQRYLLVDPGAFGVVYALKESMKGSDPPHYICATCYQSEKKSILHARIGSAPRPTLNCPICKTELQCLGRGQPMLAYALG